MKRTVNIFLLICLMAFGANLWAQKAAKPVAGGKKLIVPNVYLGKSQLSGGAIKKSQFDDLLRQGLTSKDSLGNSYRVVGFQFSYAERNVYEDSIGNMQQMFDYAYEYCAGDTITSTISASIYDRTKPGDTIYFDRVSVALFNKKTNQYQPDDQAIGARGMKFYIVR